MLAFILRRMLQAVVVMVVVAFVGFVGTSVVARYIERRG